MMINLILSIIRFIKKKIDIISKILFILSVLFSVIYFSNLVHEFEFNISQWIILLYVIPIRWIWLMINSYIYYLLLSDIKIEISKKQATSIWLKSNLSIYMPGKIGLILTRISYHKVLKHDIDKITFTIFSETLLGIMSSIIVVCFTSLFIVNTKNSIPINGYILIFAILLGIMSPPIINYSQNIYAKLKNISIKNYHVSYKTMSFVLFLGIVKWLLWGMVAWWMVNNLTEIGFAKIPYLIFTYSTATLLSTLAFFTPSGIGVMEIYTTELFSMVMPAALAATLSILLRLWKIFGEISILAFLKVFKE